MLGHSHSSRVGLELLLVEHTVHLTALAAGRGGISPADSGSNIRAKSVITTVGPETAPVGAGRGGRAPAADGRGPRLHVHSAAEQLQVHVHLQQGKMLNPKSKNQDQRSRKQRVNQSHTSAHLAGGGLHHAVVGAHYASVRLGNRGLSVDGGLGLGGRGRERQEGLGST